MNQNQTPPKQIGEMPFLPAYFVDRQDELKWLRQTCLQKEPNDFCVVLVSGQGGVGKTSLVGQYVRTYFNDYHHIIGLSGDNLQASLKNLWFSFLGSPPPEHFDTAETLRTVLQQIRNLPTPSLLVVDNLNELAELEKHYQHLRLLNFDVLITTRLTHFNNLPTLALKGLPADYAKGLFCKDYTPKIFEMPILESILEAVEYNALVVSLLAKNMVALNQNKQTYTFENLLRDLRVRGLLYLDQEKTVNPDSPHFQKATPSDILKALYKINSLNEAQQTLLTVWSVLPTRSLAYAVLETVLLPYGDIEDTLNDLVQLGWIEREERDKPLFRLLPLVCELVQHYQKATLIDCVTPLLVHLCDLIDETNEDIQLLDIIHHYLPIAETVLERVSRLHPALTAEMMNLLEDIQHLQQNILHLSADKAMSQDALIAYIEAHEEAGKPNPMLLEAYSGLVSMYEQAFRYEEALATQQKITLLHRESQHLPALARSLGKEAELCIHWYASHTYTYALQCLEEQGALLHYLLAKDVVTWKNNISIVLVRLGGRENLLRAKKLLLQVVAFEEKRGKKGETNVTSAQSNLASVLQDLGDEQNLIEAKKLLLQVLATETNVLEEMHPKIAIRHNNLASVLEGLGGEQNLQEAKQHYKKALHILAYNQMQNHPHYQMYVENFFCLFVSMTTGKDAKEFSKMELEAMTRDFWVWVEKP